MKTVKSIVRTILLGALALALGYLLGMSKVNADDCTPQLTQAVHVHTIVGGFPVLLVFAYVDMDCDQEADFVYVYRYLGRFEGQHHFQKVGVLDTDDAAILIERTRKEGRST